MAKVDANSSINFTQGIKRLEEIINKLEKPDMDLEESLELLEEGVKLHKLCRSKLVEANAKITTILKDEYKVKEKGGE